MPLKRRVAKMNSFRPTAEAAARWREVGPDAIDAVCIVDEALAEALGLPWLMAMSDGDLAALVAALDEATGGKNAA